MTSLLLPLPPKLADGLAAEVLHEALVCCPTTPPPPPPWIDGTPGPGNVPPAPTPTPVAVAAPAVTPFALPPPPAPSIGADVEGVWPVPTTSLAVLAPHKPSRSFSVIGSAGSKMKKMVGVSTMSTIIAQFVQPSINQNYCPSSTLQIFDKTANKLSVLQSLFVLSVLSWSMLLALLSWAKFWAPSPLVSLPRSLELALLVWLLVELPSPLLPNSNESCATAIAGSTTYGFSTPNMCALILMESFLAFDTDCNYCVCAFLLNGNNLGPILFKILIGTVKFN